MLTLEKGETADRSKMNEEKKDPPASRGAPLTHIWRRWWVVTFCSVNRGWQSPSKWARNYIWRRPSRRSDVGHCLLLTLAPSKKREKLTPEVYESSGCLLSFSPSSFKTTFMWALFIHGGKRANVKIWFNPCSNQCAVQTCLHNAMLDVTMGLTCFRTD